jgi:endoglucanase
MRLTINRRAATAAILAALATAPAAVRAAAPAIKVPSRGFNLPDWLAGAPREPSGAVLERLRALGFETIRLPIDPAFLATSGAVAHTAAVLAQLTRAGYNVIVDMHPGALDFDTDPAAAADRLDAAWAALAACVADAPADLVFAELLNEPPMSAAAWDGLRARLAATVRRGCPDHTLVWGPARVQGIWELDDTTPLADGNSIAAVHYYTPMGFTHQCEDWDDSPLARIRNLPFPTTRDPPRSKRWPPRSPPQATARRSSFSTANLPATGAWRTSTPTSAASPPGRAPTAAR